MCLCQMLQRKNYSKSSSSPVHVSLSDATKKKQLKIFIFSGPCVRCYKERTTQNLHILRSTYLCQMLQRKNYSKSSSSLVHVSLSDATKKELLKMFIFSGPCLFARCYKEKTTQNLHLLWSLCQMLQRKNYSKSSYSPVHVSLSDATKKELLKIFIFSGPCLFVRCYKERTTQNIHLLWSMSLCQMLQRKNYSKSSSSLVHVSLSDATKKELLKIFIFFGPCLFVRCYKERTTQNLHLLRSMSLCQMLQRKNNSKSSSSLVLCHTRKNYSKSSYSPVHVSLSDATKKELQNLHILCHDATKKELLKIFIFSGPCVRCYKERTTQNLHLLWSMSLCQMLQRKNYSKSSYSLCQMLQRRTTHLHLLWPMSLCQMLQRKNYSNLHLLWSMSFVC